MHFFLLVAVSKAGWGAIFFGAESATKYGALLESTLVFQVQERFVGNAHEPTLKGRSLV